MPYRPSPGHIAKAQQVAAWPRLPDAVFDDLGAGRAAIAEFSRALTGMVVLPGEGVYEQAARSSFRQNTNRPKIIVYCDVEQDIRLCLEWAKRYGWWAVPRSGGHSTAGYSVNDGMVIDISRMNGVHVDPGGLTATIGAGATFGTINAVLESYGLHLPGGICPDVGIAGYMQGGGYSYTSRQFGMNCDNVIGFRMMLRNGRTVKATADQNTDLFWAVRGGTGNNFGVLVDITYRLYRVPQIWAFGLAWSRDAGPRVLAEIQNRTIQTVGPSKLGFIAFISDRSDMGDGPMLSMRGLYLGSADEGKAELAALMETGDAVMDVDTVQSYPVALKAIDDTELFDIAWDKVLEDKQACYIDKTLDEADWAAVFDYFTHAPTGTVNVACLEAYGGAIRQRAPDACAFVHRSADFDFFVDTFWTDGADAASAGAWLDGFMDLMAPYSNGGVYQNYPRRSLTDTNRRYFGANYDRLLAVKNKYDPVPRMFHFQQGICTRPDDPGEFHNEPPPAGFTGEPILYEPHSKAATSKMVRQTGDTS